MLIALGLQSLRKGFQIRKKENIKNKIIAEKWQAADQLNLNKKEESDC